MMGKGSEISSCVKLVEVGDGSMVAVAHGVGSCKPGEWAVRVEVICMEGSRLFACTPIGSEILRIKIAGMLPKAMKKITNRRYLLFILFILSYSLRVNSCHHLDSYRISKCPLKRLESWIGILRFINLKTSLTAMTKILAREFPLMFHYYRIRTC
jgi:hypothetical protein